MTVNSYDSSLVPHPTTFPPHVHHSDDAAVSGGQSPEPRRAASVSHGGFLRTVLRRRRAGGEAAQSDADQPRQELAQPGPDGRVSLSRAQRLFAEARSSAGVRAAICEQVEDPKTAKGLVKREVTQVVTPGTLTDEALLDPRESNFLACVWGRAQGWHPLTPAGSPGSNSPPADSGRAMSLPPTSSTNSPASARPNVSSPKDMQSSPLAGEFAALPGLSLSERPAWSFSVDNCRRLLLEQFQTKTLDGFDVDANSPGVVAAGALLDYVRETQKSNLAHITKLEPYRRGSCLLIDEATRRSLELTRTMRDGSREGSLLAVIDETVTPMGARLLADWLSNPLTEAAAINRRFDAVAGVYDRRRSSSRSAGTLETMPTICNGSRLARRPAGPHRAIWLASRELLRCCRRSKRSCRAGNRRLAADLEGRLELLPELRAEIEAALVDEPPLVAH